MEHRKHHRGAIVSLVPGRLRVKLHPESRAAHVMKGIADDLKSREGIQDVAVNPASGSLTVQYDRARHSASGILGLLEDLDVVIESTTHALQIETSEATGGREAQRQDFLAAIDDLNARVHGATGVPFDLRIILPLSFAGAGVWSIVKNGLMIESIPGWLFLWLAFDMFVKMHPPRLVQLHAPTEESR